MVTKVRAHSIQSFESPKPLEAAAPKNALKADRLILQPSSSQEKGVFAKIIDNVVAVFWKVIGFFLCWKTKAEQTTSSHSSSASQVETKAKASTPKNKTLPLQNSKIGIPLQTAKDAPKTQDSIPTKTPAEQNTPKTTLPKVRSEIPFPNFKATAIGDHPLLRSEKASSALLRDFEAIRERSLAALSFTPNSQASMSSFAKTPASNTPPPTPAIPAPKSPLTSPNVPKQFSFQETNQSETPIKPIEPLANPQDDNKAEPTTTISASLKLAVETSSTPNPQDDKKVEPTTTEAPVKKTDPFMNPREPYVKALIEILRKEGDIDTTCKSLLENPELRDLLKDPDLSEIKQYLETCEDVFNLINELDTQVTELARSLGTRMDAWQKSMGKLPNQVQLLAFHDRVNKMGAHYTIYFSDILTSLRNIRWESSSIHDLDELIKKLEKKYDAACHINSDKAKEFYEEPKTKSVIPSSPPSSPGDQKAENKSSLNQMELEAKRAAHRRQLESEIEMLFPIDLKDNATLDKAKKFFDQFDQIVFKVSRFQDFANCYLLEIYKPLYCTKPSFPENTSQQEMESFTQKCGEEASDLMNKLISLQEQIIATIPVEQRDSKDVQFVLDKIPLNNLTQTIVLHHLETLASTTFVGPKSNDPYFAAVLQKVILPKIEALKSMGISLTEEQRKVNRGIFTIELLM